MPELPEVETVRVELAPHVVGRRIVEGWGFISPTAKFDQAAAATGATVTALGRRGKYLLASLDDDRELVVHLGMTGGLFVRPAVDVPESGEAHLRAWWRFDDGNLLAFRDARRFGRVAVVPAGHYESLPTLFAQGPEPLDDAFTPLGFWKALRASDRRMKTQLLSQRPVAGVGNIYADEALWRAAVHPARRRISRAQAFELHTAVREVLAAAIANRGTTLRDYRAPDGSRGDNQFHLDCYGRSGLPCRRCGTVLVHRTYDARTATFCPRCQRS